MIGLGVNLGYHNGKEIWPRNIRERNKALFLYNNHICSIWKSQGVSFNKAIEGIKSNFGRKSNEIIDG